MKNTDSRVFDPAAIDTSAICHVKLHSSAGRFMRYTTDTSHRPNGWPRFNADPIVKHEEFHGTCAPRASTCTNCSCGCGCARIFRIYVLKSPRYSCPNHHLLHFPTILYFPSNLFLLQYAYLRLSIVYWFIFILNGKTTSIQISNFARMIKECSALILNSDRNHGIKMFKWHQMRTAKVTTGLRVFRLNEILFSWRTHPGKDTSIAYSRVFDAPWLIGRVKNEKSDLDINNTCIYFFSLIWKIDK